MAGTDDLGARLRATFLQELEDQLREVDAALIALEADPRDAEGIRVLFRAAHSIKGAARVAAAPLVEEATHALEAIFAQARDGERVFGDADFALLFAAADALRDAHGRLTGGEPLDASPLAAVMPRLRGAAGGAGKQPRSATGRAATAPVATTPAAPDPAGAPHAVAHADPAPAPESSAERRPGTSTTARAQSEETVRIPSAKLDALAANAADLLIASGGIRERPEAIEQLRVELAAWAAAWRRRSLAEASERGRALHAELDRELHVLTESTARLARGSADDARALDRVTGTMLNSIRTMRLRAFGDATQGLPRVVRDVAAATGKQVDLVITGEEVEADRVVIDTLREPLVHLVRNAIDHGIETAAARRAAGKPERGTIRVTAELERGRLKIVVQDDGAGIDEAAARARIAARGEEAPADARALAQRLLAGGVTTRDEATSISGRGVGLDLVRAALERIGGSVEMRWRSGEYTRFVIDSPPSPSMMRSLVAEVSGQLFALPIGQVERVVRVTPAHVREVGGRASLLLGDAPVPLATLAAVMGPPLRDRADISNALALVVRAGADPIGLVVDDVHEEVEVVVRPLDDRAHVPHVAGGALLPSGRVALVLSARSLVEAGSGREVPAPVLAIEVDAAAPALRLLVVDDSITTRTLEQSVLEAAGYDVTVAVDGQDAWDRLQSKRFDLVVSDVEMPRMTGFDLCRRMRDSRRFAEVPVVLVTGLESAEDRALGLEVGADAYLVKSSFDQSTLLDTIRQLVG